MTRHSGSYLPPWVRNASRPPGRPRQERCKHGHSIAVWAYYRPDGGRECGACRAWRSAGLPAQPGYHGYAEAKAALAAILC